MGGISGAGAENYRGSPGRYPSLVARDGKQVWDAMRSVVELRRALSCFPTGVAIVTATDRAGSPVGVTINSFASVSLDPPLVLWSLDRKAYSLPIFQAARNFAINILSEDQREISTRFASGGSDKWSGTDFVFGNTAFPHLKGPPHLQGVVAVLDCEVYAINDGGDHLIILGKVVAISSQPDKAPLVFHLGRYRDLAADCVTDRSDIKGI